MTVSNTDYINKLKKSITKGDKIMINQVMEFLEGLKMTILSGVFLLISAIIMIFGVDVPVYLNPAWITVIISELKELKKV